MLQEVQNPNTDSSNQDLFGLPVETDILFSNHKGIYKRTIEKRQRKLLKKISFIRPFLHEDEKIFCVTSGYSNVSFIELLLTGWIVFYLKRSLFVFTNTRIFHIPTKYNFSYRNSIAQILYADCHSINIKGHALKFEYKSGKKEKFIYIPRRERKKIRTLLNDISFQGQSSPMLQRTHLCPRCTNLLIEGQYVCPNCSLQFKSKARARKVSIIYPGGGYFYTGHPFLGFGDALVEIYLTIAVLVALLGVATGTPGSVSEFIFFGLILTFEKSLTVYHTNQFIKEYIPKDRSINKPTARPKPPKPTKTTSHKPEEILSASWRRT